jgi:hypothetical protein
MSTEQCLGGCCQRWRAETPSHLRGGLGGGSLGGGGLGSGGLGAKGGKDRRASGGGHSCKGVGMEERVSRGCGLEKSLQ